MFLWPTRKEVDETIYLKKGREALDSKLCNCFPMNVYAPQRPVLMVAEQLSKLLTKCNSMLPAYFLANKNNIIWGSQSVELETFVNKGFHLMNISNGIPHTLRQT